MWLRAWVMLGLVAGVGGCCNPANIGSVQVPLDPQQESNWCWAASGEMTMNYVHTASNVQQCDEANRYFGQTNCCQNPGSAQCNNSNGGWPQYAQYNFTADMVDGTPLTFAQIQSQIYCAKKPFAFSWHWNGGGGHMMVATGYVTIDGVNYVSVNNPWAPNVGAMEVYTYDKFVGGAGQDHTHWRDYYNIAFSGGT